MQLVVGHTLRLGAAGGAAEPPCELLIAAWCPPVWEGHVAEIRQTCSLLLRLTPISIGQVLEVRGMIEGCKIESDRITKMAEVG